MSLSLGYFIGDFHTRLGQLKTVLERINKGDMRENMEVLDEVDEGLQELIQDADDVNKMYHGVLSNLISQMKMLHKSIKMHKK